jgi:hypothetical protein
MGNRAPLSHLYHPIYCARSKELTNEFRFIELRLEDCGYEDSRLQGCWNFKGQVIKTKNIQM